MVDQAIASRKAALTSRGGSAEAILTPAPAATRISLRAGADALPALSAALGVTLPTRPKTSTSSGQRHALWIGPDEWLVFDEGEADLMAAAASSGTLHSAVDISHRNVAVIVSGAGAHVAVNSGCPQDLSLPIFPVGACSRTIFGKAEIILLRTGEDQFRVECWRSFSPFVFGLLSEGAADAGH